jgi:hypothetical protein
MKPEQERLITVLKDTIALLCRNSLTYEDQVQVQGLICITVDKQDVLVVPVHERFGRAEYEPCVACGHAKEPPFEHSEEKELQSLSPGAASDQEDDIDNENGGMCAEMEKDVESNDEESSLSTGENIEQEQEHFLIVINEDGDQSSSQSACVTAAPLSPQGPLQQLSSPSESSASIFSPSTSFVSADVKTSTPKVRPLRQVSFS